MSVARERSGELSPEWEPYVEAAARAIFDSWKLSPSDEAGWDDCVRTARVALAAALDLVPTTECPECNGEANWDEQYLCWGCNTTGRVPDGSRLLLVRQVGWLRDGRLKHDDDMLIRNNGFGYPKGGPEVYGWEPVYVALSEEQESKDG